MITVRDQSEIGFYENIFGKDYHLVKSGVEAMGMRYGRSLDEIDQWAESNRVTSSLFDSLNRDDFGYSREEPVRKEVEMYDNTESAKLFKSVMEKYEWLKENYHNREKLVSIHKAITDMFDVIIGYEEEMEVGSFKIVEDSIFELLNSTDELLQKMIDEEMSIRDQEKKSCSEQVEKFYIPKIDNMRKVIESMKEDITLG